MMGMSGIMGISGMKGMSGMMGISGMMGMNGMMGMSLRDKIQVKLTTKNYILSVSTYISSYFDV